MRILLVLDRVENPASANALMGFRLAEQLLRRDHTVHTPKRTPRKLACEVGFRGFCLYGKAKPPHSARKLRQQNAAAY